MQAAQEKSTRQETKLYECFLQGAIPKDTYDALVERLQGMCDVQLPLHHKEIVFIAPLVSSPTTTSSEHKNELRVRHNALAADKQCEWTLHYVGMPSNRLMLVNVRNIIDVEVSHNIAAFLPLMGYQYQYEFVREGVVFRDRNQITTSITRIKKTLDKEDVFSAVPLEESWLVEVSAVTTDAGIQVTSEKVNAFADYLMPMVEMKRYDYFKLEREESESATQPGGAQMTKTEVLNAPKQPPPPPPAAPPPLTTAPPANGGTGSTRGRRGRQKGSTRGRGREGGTKSDTTGRSVIQLT